MFLKSVLIVTATIVMASAQTAPRGTADRIGSGGGLTAADQKFVEDVAKGGADEVEMGKVAIQKGSSKKVKDFGQRMITDHAKASNELQALAKRKGWTLPAAGTEDRKDLSAKTGPDFDKAYAEEMVKDHEKDVSDFEREANAALDPDLKAFAAKTLPTLREHLTQAKALP